MQPKIKNTAPRILSFGRVLMLRPGEVQQITSSQFEQLRRDRTIRTLIKQKVIAVQPANLFDLEEDPQELDPVDLPPARENRKLLDSRAARQPKRVAQPRALSGDVESWSDDEDFGDDRNDDDEVKPVKDARAVRRDADIVNKENRAPKLSTQAFSKLSEDQQIEAASKTEDLDQLRLMYQTTKHDKVRTFIDEYGTKIKLAKEAALKESTKP